MRFRRITALAVKEVLQIWRDPRSLIIALLLPFTQMFLFGYGVNLDLRHLPVCTFDREGSQLSHRLTWQVSPSRRRPAHVGPHHVGAHPPDCGQGIHRAQT